MPDTTEQAIARALAALSTERYQRCLNAVRVLRPLAGVLDLGDLAAVINDAPGRRLLGIRVDESDLTMLTDVFRAYPPAGGDAWALNRDTSECRLVVPLAVERHEVVLDMALDGRLWPAGPWQIAVPELAAAVTSPVRSDDPHSRPSLAVPASPTSEIAVPPDITRGTALAGAAVFTARLRRTRGQRFDWLSAPGLSPMPEPLVTCALRLATTITPAADAEGSTFAPAPAPGAWYGIDITEGVRIWFDARPAG